MLVASRLRDNSFLSKSAQKSLAKLTIPKGRLNRMESQPTSPSPAASHTEDARPHAADQITSAQGNLSRLIREMPKAELHIHLEGSISPKTLLALAQRHGLEERLPSKDADILAEWFQFTDFPHFIEVYLTISECLRDEDDFAFIAEAYAETAAAQNIVYAEMTVTPFTHTHFQDKNITIDAILKGLEAGRVAAARHGVDLRWVFDVPRNFSFSKENGAYDPFPADKTLSYALRGRDQGVIGFGLGGDEVNAPPAPFAHAFRRAVAAGLMSVPHAGETEGPASVWDALQFLQARRLGHGVRAIEDPALLSVLRDTQIPLELNISSNICLHLYNKVDQHPFPLLDKMGLLVTVNSDDPPLFNTTLLQEYELLAENFGYGIQDLSRIARNAFLAAGLPRAEKRRQLARFDNWVAQSKFNQQATAGK